jgi:hypothetical protein
MVKELLLINIPAIMRLGPEDDHPPPYCVEVKNEQGYTFTVTQHVLNSYNFTFIFTLIMELSSFKLRLQQNLINLNFAG